jgi:2'-5' RNA ligase
MATNGDQPIRESWRDDYQYGAFYLFPPADIATAVDQLRARYDPRSAAICGAHVSLSEPLTRPLSDEQLAEVRDALATFTPFAITFGPVRSFDPHPGVVFTITPEDTFFALRSAVHATSIFSGHATPRSQRAPHMTIAEFISLEETHHLVDQLKVTTPGGTFLCDHVVYARPDASFHFEPVLAIPLGGEIQHRYL